MQKDQTEQDNYNPSGPDPMLDMLVDMAHSAGMATPVTLTVGGALISGTIVGGEQYFTEVADRIRGGSGNESVLDSLSQFYESIAEQYKELHGGRGANSEKEDNGEEIGKPPIAYIHLNNVRIFGQGTVPLTLDLWRGKLSSIDGWTMGSMQVSE